MEADPAPIIGDDTTPGQGLTPLVQSYPSWMDPGYVLATSETQPARAITVGANQVVKIGGDARRWAIGFHLPAGSGTDLTISPSPRPASFVLATLAAGKSAWFPLSQFGTLVPYEWYITSTGAVTVNVIEVVLR